MKKDVVLDRLKGVERFDIDEMNEGDEKITAEDLMQSICLLDDVDTIADKKIRVEILELRDDLLETGRHQRVTTICFTHQIFQGTKGKKTLSETTSVVLFPRAGSMYHIERYVKVYCGLPSKTLKRVIQVPSRWVLISRTYPMYVVHERGAFLL